MSLVQGRHNSSDDPERERLDEALTTARAALDAATTDLQRRDAEDSVAASVPIAPN
jgi:hypothetical protein